LHRTVSERNLRQEHAREHVHERYDDQSRPHDLLARAIAGEVEDVGTLPEHRGRGYATAVVLAAIAAARADGAEFVFLVADLDDWPKELYRKLGFDELGYFVKLVSPGV